MNCLMINVWNNQWSKSFVAALVIVLLLLSDECAYIGYFSTVLCEEEVYCKMLFQSVIFKNVMFNLIYLFVCLFI